MAAHTLLGPCAAVAGMQQPDWHVGDWWRIEETVDIEIQAEGFQAGSEILTEDDTKYEITEIAPRTQSRSGQTYNVYVMDFKGAGTLQASGTFKMIGLSYDVRIVNGDHTGEQWNRVEDMYVVMTRRRLSGLLEGKGPDGQWRPFGPFEINMWDEYDPPIPYGYPLEVGKHFNYTLQADLFGNYSLNFAGLQIANEFTKTQRWDLSCAVPSIEGQTGCQYQEASYYIDANHSQDGVAARQQGWVEPRIKWYNRVDISRFQHPLGIVRSAYLCLSDANVRWEPDPTPTPPPEDISLNLQLNQPDFQAGDAFALIATLVNPSNERPADLYVALDLSSLGLTEPYYFWPSWSKYPPGIDRKRLALPTGESREDILQFTWPAGAGAAEGLSFISVVLDPDTALLLSGIAQAEFGFH